MRTHRTLALIAVLAIPVTVAALDPPLVDGATGRSVSWSEWTAANGPAVVIVFASWAPKAQQVVAQREAIASACAEKGLELVVIGVQEPIEDTRAALEATGWQWFHDRHGQMLKDYRVIEVPSVVVVSADGEVVARLAASAQAISTWSAP